jgi:hypothetical protein
MKKTMVWATSLGALALFAFALPDIKRYIKISTM